MTAEPALAGFCLRSPSTSARCNAEVGSAVTNGLRFQAVTALYPQELCCTLLVEQEEATRKIVVRVGQMVLEGAYGVLTGTVIPGNEPLAP